MSPTPAERQSYAMAAAACACNNLRTASRAITQRFDRTLEPSGLRSSQLVILLEIAAGGHSTVPQLARRLVTDRSTMQRNVQPLLKRGLIRIDARKAQRSRELTLTARGRRAIDAAVPLWERAQSSFVRQFGAGRWESLREGLSAAVAAARGESLAR
jgi:DNA-binding MarR family transcriptional regulator